MPNSCRSVGQDLLSLGAGVERKMGEEFPVFFVLSHGFTSVLKMRENGTLGALVLLL